MRCPILYYSNLFFAEQLYGFGKKIPENISEKYYFSVINSIFNKATAGQPTTLESKIFRKAILGNTCERVVQIYFFVGHKLFATTW